MCIRDRVAPYYLPEDTVNALQDALAAYGEDRNGDGKVVVTLNVYTLDSVDSRPQRYRAAQGGYQRVWQAAPC